MKLTTVDKINAGFAVALGVVALIGFVSYGSMKRSAATAATVADTHEVIASLNALLSHLSDAESSQRGYVITGQTEYLNRYFSADTVINRIMRQLREKRFEDPNQTTRLARLGALVARRLALIRQGINLRTSSGFEDAQAMVASGRGRELMDSVTALAYSIERFERSQLLQRTEASRISERRAEQVVSAGGIFAFAVVLLASLLIRRDIMQRRRVEHALRESEAMLGQFMESLPVGAYVIDAAGRPRFANTAARELLGRSLAPGATPEDLNDIYQLYRASSNDLYPAAEMPLVQALAGFRTTIEDAELRREDRIVPLQVSAAPIYDAGGRIAHAIAVFSDITARKRAESALLTAKEAAEEANRTKSDFLARMSHELRTPLNSVIGFANILLKNKAGNLRPQEMTYLERIQENGKHLLTLINDVLDLSKIEAGKIEIEQTAFVLNDLVREVVRQWDGQMTGSVRLIADLPEEHVTLVADRDRLKQVVINLLSNAIKFTQEGTVTVSIDVNAAGEAERLHVRDTGIGVPADRLDAIFEAFEQAESSTARKYGGTGLGLPISRKLTELMGFSLDVRSEVGKGSTFTIEFTAARAEPLDSPSSPQRSVTTGERVVLVVDDEDDSRVLLTHHLEEFGCKVVSTGSGSEALQLARDLSPVLITLDLMMPEMSGWEVLSQLKADARLADIPVVIISMVAGEHRTSLLGAIDILEKPIDRDTLYNVLRRNLVKSDSRVLIVDDDADARTLLADHMQRISPDVRTASDGLAALAMLDTFRPDIVLLDLVMPRLDGLGFLEKFRSMPDYVETPVIVVTASDLSRSERRRIEDMTTAVVQKGNMLDEELNRVLKRLVSGA